MEVVNEEIAELLNPAKKKVMDVGVEPAQLSPVTLAPATKCITPNTKDQDDDVRQIFARPASEILKHKF